MQREIEPSAATPKEKSSTALSRRTNGLARLWRTAARNEPEKTTFVLVDLMRAYSNRRDLADALVTRCSNFSRRKCRPADQPIASAPRP
jgi:hypothetical protein